MIKNKIVIIIGIANPMYVKSNTVGIRCIKHIKNAIIYAIHFIGLYSLNALKYSFKDITATIAITTSITYLLPNNNTRITNGNPNNAEVTLFISIYFPPNFLVLLLYSNIASSKSSVVKSGHNLSVK